MDMDKKLASGALSSFEPNDNWTKMDAFLFDILFIYLKDFENRLTDCPLWARYGRRGMAARPSLGVCNLFRFGA
jgi:hypothetical protein